MKVRRQEKILELIAENDINTQEELLDYLSSAGYFVTQATISRDIKDLRLVKTLSPSGKYKYTPEKAPAHDISSKFNTLYTDSVISTVSCGNLVVIKTISGLAGAVCAALDSLEMREIIGTIAGDDTIFVACANDSAAQSLTLTLRKLPGSRS